MSGPKCEKCDHACENYLNEDAECLGSLTQEERAAVNQAIVTKFETPKVEVPKTKIESGFTWD